MSITSAERNLHCNQVFLLQGSHVERDKLHIYPRRSKYVKYD